MTTCFAVVMKFLGKYMSMYLIFSCAKGATYLWQNSILIFDILRFGENISLNLVLIAVAHESDWWVSIIRNRCFRIPYPTHIFTCERTKTSGHGIKHKTYEESAAVRWTPSKSQTKITKAMYRKSHRHKCKPSSGSNRRRKQMSRDMTKPTKWVCTHRRLRSAWASARFDQSSLSAWRNLGS